MARTTPAYDHPWKTVLERYFQEFLAFCFPTIAHDVDWGRGHEFLDSELRQITRDAAVGPRAVDKLVRLWRADGSEEWVLIHVEVQVAYERNFAERMYVYNNRIYDKYRRHVASLAVLADDVPRWRPTHFGYELWGCTVSLTFPIAKVIDLVEQAETPSAGVFGLVVIAHVDALRTRGSPEERLHRKSGLARRLYESGLNRSQIVDLLRFIDWVMALSEELEQAFIADVHQLEKDMRVITGFERILMERGMKEGREKGLQQGIEEGIKKGIEKGIAQGLCDAILETLEIRFSSPTDDRSERIRSIASIDALRELQRNALTAPDIETFDALLDASITTQRTTSKRRKDS